MSTDRDAKYSLVQSKIKNDPLSADLQWSLFVGALQSYRCDTVLRPFPPSFCFENGEKDVKRLERCVDKVQNLQELMTQSDISEEIVDLVTWVLDKPFQICLRKDIRFEDVKKLTKECGNSTKPNYIFEVVPNELTYANFEEKSW